MDTPRTSLLDLHPVEALLVLLWISAAALHRLVADPPRPMWQQRVPYSSAAIAMPAFWNHEPEGSGVISPEIFEKAWRATPAPDVICPSAATAQEWADTHIRQPQASAAPAHGIAPGVTVAELRTMARQQGLAQVGGRPIHKARKVDLLAALDA